MNVYHLLDTALTVLAVGTKQNRLNKNYLSSSSFRSSWGDSKIRKKHVVCEITVSATKKKRKGREKGEFGCNFK